METKAIDTTHAEVIDEALATHDDMSDFEMAVAAAQGRASIGRMREFVKFQPAEDQALQTAMNILATFIPDHIRAR